MDKRLYEKMYNWRNIRTMNDTLRDRIYNAILDHGGELTPKIKELVSNFTDDLINADDNLAEIVEK